MPQSKSQASKLSSNVIPLIKEKYPRFSKITLCMVNNPEYGVVLAPGAKKLLNRANTTVKQRDTKVISARLNDDVVERLKIYARDNNLTVNQLIAQVIEEKIGEAVDT